MGGVELGKSFLGRDNEKAWVVGAVIPGGVMGIWRRCPYKGMRTGLALAAWGVAYQYSTNNNLVNTFLVPNTDNPNIPYVWDPFNRDTHLWDVSRQGTDKEWSQIPQNMGVHPKDPGPSWKKWEE